MKNLFFIALSTVLILTMNSGPSYGQGLDELGALPPLPDLDLGDPERKLSVWQRAKANKKAAAKREEENSYTRGPDGQQARVHERMQRGFDENAKKHTARTRSTEITVNNNISSDDAVTASGSRLRPFGSEEVYWGDAMYETTPEETLFELAPLPDLRTPDQITWMERYRNHRLAKFKVRKAEADAAREAKEFERRATVNQPMRDPDSALVLVESQSGSFGNYVGNSEAPVNANNGTLRPFNSSSTFVKDNQLVYRGNNNPQRVDAWLEQGTKPSNPNPEQSKWHWMNPFRSSGNQYEKPVNRPAGESGAVSRGGNGPAGSYAAGDPTLDATPLTSSLRGIVVVPNTREVSTSVSGVSGLEMRKVDLPPKVFAVLESYIGQSMTLGDLNKMVRAAVLAYRKSDMPVVDVLVPEQDITSGVLQLVVIEGRLGDVIVEGASRRDSENLSGQIHLNRGEVIRESQLLEDLNWLNKHPSRQVDLIYSPGQNYGETDIILRSQQYKALSAYIAYENSGSVLLGQSRALFGASWTGPMFWDSNTILSYQFTTNFDNTNNLWGHSGVYSSYLPWGHQVTLLGAYVETDAVFGNAVGNFSTRGTNKQVSGRYAIPLMPFARITHELELGMDFKSSNSDLNFNTAAVFSTVSEIVQYSLGYNIIARDKTGTWRLDSEFVSSPGNNTDNNRDAIFASQRVGASSNYTYGRVVIERDQMLPNGWTAFGRLQLQRANGNLLGSETLGAGGYDSVRGFEQRITRGDNGYVGTVELRSPSVYPSNLGGYFNMQDALMGLVFYDFANLNNATPLVGERDISLGSVGVGLRYQVETWFSLRVDYGVQVNDDLNDGSTGRWHVGARATF